ncbi:hypothetical protein BN871_BX_00710 [Paenibacillus sp. P22]|nr:hypothetical protein BN871_BX_00710 [Paenibacillus sp. P22]
MLPFGRFIFFRIRDGFKAGQEFKRESLNDPKNGCKPLHEDAIIVPVPKRRIAGLILFLLADCMSAARMQPTQGRPMLSGYGAAW